MTVTVRRRPEIADPQGATAARALADLGYREVTSVRIDRTIHLDLDGDDPAEVEARVDEMCRRLLANPVIEDYEVTVDR